MTPTSLADYDLSPDIIIEAPQYRQLTRLALAGAGHTADDADWLLFELERAMIVPEGAAPPDVVRLGSDVRFRTGGEVRRVTLVLPAEADIGANRVSVLTPVGTALLGLRRGQSITWLARDGRKRALTVLDVTPPPTDDDPPAAA